MLIVEDDPAMTEALSYLLGQAGFSVDVVGSAHEACVALAGTSVDLLIVDDHDGSLPAFEQLRANCLAPILVLGAHADVADVLDSGVDVYLTKPFSFSELVARMRTLLRRSRNLRPGRPPARDLRLDPARLTVTLAGRAVALAPVQFAVVATLADNPGRVVSRDQLTTTVWGPGAKPSENLLNVHIRHIRDRIEPDPSRPKHLITIRGLGYRLDP